MAGAKIGALHVALGIDSAQFSAGLKKAQSGLASFSKVAAVGFAAAATAAVAAGAALAVAGKRAIDTADDMSKAAQKTGVATEALSRLNYAAGYADVSLEQLTGGLGKLTKNLADVASGKGGSAATALSALGISATDTEGRLRASDAVFADIADRFARLENGSTKTALAMQLFGRSGADLIPLLNSGRDGLAAMADESDRLGVTVSTKTGRAAEQFNDTLTKVGRIVDGVAMKVAEAALPALQDLADLLASPEVAQAAQTLGTTMVEAFNLVVQAVASTTNAIKGFLDWLNGMDGSGPLANSLLPGEKANLGDSVRAASARANSAYPIPASSLYAGFGFGADGQMNVEAPASTGINLPIFSDSGATEAMAQRLEALRASLRTEEEAENESYARRKEAIQGFLDDKAITTAEYDELMLRAQQDHSDKMVEIAKEQAEKEAAVRYALADTAASIFGSLATIAENAGEENLAAAKAFGVAQAIVSTAAGIMKAFEQTGILGWASAASIAAAGAAQISTILSTNKGSSTKPTVGGSGAATSTAAVTPASSSGLSLTLRGTPEDRVRLGDVEGVFQQLQEYLGTQGKQLDISYRGA